MVHPAFERKNLTISGYYLLCMVAFVQTVETGSFTAAAARMGLSKSAAGKNVVRLEQRLGVKLGNVFFAVIISTLLI